MSTGFFDDFDFLPKKSFGQIMDELFNMWIADGTDKTFDEFLQPAS